MVEQLGSAPAGQKGCNYKVVTKTLDQPLKKDFKGFRMRRKVSPSLQGEGELLLKPRAPLAGCSGEVLMLVPFQRATS